MSDPIRINIPSRPTLRQQAGQIVIEALREAGVDPKKALGVPIIPSMVQTWGRGEWTREEFVANCRKILILNPSLALGA